MLYLISRIHRTCSMNLNEKLFCSTIILMLITVACLSFGCSSTGRASSGPAIRPDGWTFRTISPREIERLGKRDMDISPSIARRLLARLNARDFDYIEEDIKAGRPIKVPNDFTAFKTWTPMPGYIPEFRNFPQYILIVKDIPFIGWYEYGRLAGDSYICVGKSDELTSVGVYSVKEKDKEHISRSYKNAYGEPSPMPFALRIYEAVWIHAGDITGGYCSHGCVNLPLAPATRLFDWAAPGAPVIIVDSLDQVPVLIAQKSSNCTPFTSACLRSTDRL